MELVYSTFILPDKITCFQSNDNEGRTGMRKGASSWVWSPAAPGAERDYEPERWSMSNVDNGRRVFDADY